MRSKLFEDRKILVTGGAGSIGREIVKELLDCNPSVVRVLDNSEEGLWELDQEVKDERLRFLLGDIRDRDRLRRAIEDIDIVFHAAALKHVPICEYNPFDAIKTNVLGTQNLIDVALEEKVDKVIAISTDKAANPVNVMGATKLLMERLIVAANYFRGPRKTVLSCIRFGNVLGSSGSVIPLFERQVRKGGPVTVTDPNMTRFMMPVKDAIHLIFKASELAKGGEIFIFKMPSMKIIDLAEIVIEQLTPKYGFSQGKIKVKKVGPRPGEKIHEELMTEEEARNALEMENMFVILPQLVLTDYGYPRYAYSGSKPAKVKKYSSAEKLFTKDEIRKIVSETLKVC
jgi:FlaA1/EpsC-like NDP-sugar epimerase